MILGKTLKVAKVRRFFTFIFCVSFFTNSLVLCESMDNKAKSMDGNYYLSNGKVVKENVESFRPLRFFYNNLFGRFFRQFMNRKYFAKMVAVWQNTSFSKRKIDSFVDKHNIDMNQYEIPENGFKSFNEFFSRKLKPGMRTIDPDPKSFTAPADSKLFVIPNISQDVEFFVKEKKFNLGKFLKDEDLAKEYENGVLMIFRLAPYDYHRYHFPTDCIPGKTKVIHGLLESVNPIVYKSGYQPLLENERHMTVLKTDKFDDVVTISVGAMLVGKINETYTTDKEYKKGDEMGYFEFGGSTLVLLFKQGAITPKKEFIENSAKNLETEVKMGQVVSE